MRIRPLYGMSALALAAAATLGTTTPTTAAPHTATAACPWVGSTAPVDQRVSQVMAQITQSEEICR